MYKVLKSTGNGNVVVENTDTKASVVIGKLTLDIVNAIKEGGYEVPDYSEEWNIEVNKECATALTSMAMRMKKPVRDQSKKDKPKGKIGVEVDAFDLIFNI